MKYLMIDKIRHYIIFYHGFRTVDVINVVVVIIIIICVFIILIIIIV